MVKLFWNTHNQTKSLTNNKKDAMDHIWGLYHKENSNVWIYEILKEVKSGNLNPRDSEFTNMSKLTEKIHQLNNYQFDENL